MARKVEGPVRLVQIGIAQPHAAGYRATLRLMPDAALVAGYDPDPAAAKRDLAAENVDLPVYDDIATLLELEQPEAVLISLPPADTPDAIIVAANAGCHIFAEKPGARSAQEFVPAMEAMRNAGVQFGTGYLRHCSPVAQTIKTLVAQGLLGRLVSGEGRHITSSVASRNPDHWLFQRARSGGGILSWLGCHWLDLFRWTTGSEVREVAAILDTLSGEAIDVEDTATLALRYTNGMLATLNVGYITDHGINQSYFALRGTQGWLIWNELGAELEVRSTHPDWATAPTRTFRFEPDQIGGYGGAMGIDVFRRFFAAIRDHAEPAFVPEDALRVLETLDAAQESSRTGQRVTPAVH
jgi:predicted dehydrogenase